MKKIAILGDSYSTYEGFIPQDYISWYSDTGNALENDVHSVNDTWWMTLCRELGMEPVVNCSYSGSTVCYTGYPGYDGVATSFVHRMQREFGTLKMNGTVPDLIFLFGGTNDFWNQSPIGEIQYGSQSEDDLKSFAPAFCHAVECFLTNFPGSALVVIINDDITSRIREVMLEVCKHYGLAVVPLQSIDKQNGHPSKLGMAQIAEQIEEEIQ